MASPIYRYYVLALAMCVIILSYADRILVGLLAEAIKSDLGLTDSQLGLLSGTAFVAIYVTLGLLVGWLADRHRRVTIISAAVAIWSACTVFFGLGTTYSHLVLARLGVGMGEAGCNATSASLLVDTFPVKQRGRVLSIFYMGNSIGAALGALFAAWILTELGWRAAFVIAGSAGFILAPLVYFTVKEPSRAAPGVDALPPLPFLLSVRTMLAIPTFRRICLGAGLSSVPAFSTLFWFPSFLSRSFGAEIENIAVILGVIYLAAGITGGWIGGYLSDRLSTRGLGMYSAVPALSFALSAPLLLCAVIANSYNTALVSIFLVTLVSSAANGSISAGVQHLATGRLRGTAASIQSFSAVVIGMGVGLPFIGFVSDQLSRFGLESLRWALLLLPVFFLLAAGSFFLAARSLDRDVKQRT